MYKNWLKSKRGEDHDKYKRYRNVYISCVRAAESSYYIEKLDRRVYNQKQIWVTLNGMLGRKKTKKTKINSLIDQSGVEVSNDKDIADCMNEYFCNIGSNLRSELELKSQRLNVNVQVNHYLKEPIPYSIFIRPCSEDETRSMINSLKSGKAPGVDGITSDLLNIVRKH